MAIDTLWAGVPIITLNTDGTVENLMKREAEKLPSSHVTKNRNIDMGSRVVLSILETLDRRTNYSLLLPNLVATSLEDYKNKMIKLAQQDDVYIAVRNMIVEGVLDEGEAYWDTKSYTALFESGLDAIWNNFISCNEPKHVVALNTLDSPSLSEYCET